MLQISSTVHMNKEGGSFDFIVNSWAGPIQYVSHVILSPPELVSDTAQLT
jgi:hypothetical protein